MTIYKKTEIEGFQVIFKWDNKYMGTNTWMHIYILCSEQLPLLQVQSQTHWDKSLVWEKQKDHSGHVQATTTLKTHFK